MAWEGMGWQSKGAQRSLFWWPHSCLQASSSADGRPPSSSEAGLPPLDKTLPVLKDPPSSCHQRPPDPPSTATLPTRPRVGVEHYIHLGNHLVQPSWSEASHFLFAYHHAEKPLELQTAAPGLTHSFLLTPPWDSPLSLLQPYSIRYEMTTMFCPPGD